MKKRILLFTSSIVLLAGTLMSYDDGPAATAQLNYTGSGTGGSTCGTSGCHNGGSYTNGTMVLSLVDGITPVTTWELGKTYTLSFGIQSSAPKWGFQMSSAFFNGSINQQAGTFSALATNTHKTTITLTSMDIVEHSIPLTVSGGLCSNTCSWTAPTIPTIDTITFYVTINNVNGTGSVLGDNSNNYKVKFGRNTTSVAELNADIKINAYPNPMTDKLNISLENADKGEYSISVFDMQGKVVATQTANVNKSFSTSVNVSSWAAGMYHVQLKKGDAQRTIAVVKQ